jgi:hypothetical protein
MTCDSKINLFTCIGNLFIIYTVSVRSSTFYDITDKTLSSILNVSTYSIILACHILLAIILAIISVSAFMIASILYIITCKMHICDILQYI